MSFPVSEIVCSKVSDQVSLPHPHQRRQGAIPQYLCGYSDGCWRAARSWGRMKHFCIYNNRKHLQRNQPTADAIRALNAMDETPTTCI
jgi:hypothetical protein